MKALNEYPTPRTDAAFALHQDFPHDDESAPWLLASQLERRLAACRDALELIIKQSANYVRGYGHELAEDNGRISKETLELTKP